uniref:Uncharacterized protein n=1 Tax=Anguilla anguilla TaxID=7936 RepID=A0A0E9U3S5_ANGAN
MLHYHQKHIVLTIALTDHFFIYFFIHFFNILAIIYCKAGQHKKCHHKPKQSRCKYILSDNHYR